MNPLYLTETDVVETLAMRDALRGEKGAALLCDGVRALGAHLVRELIR